MTDRAHVQVIRVNHHLLPDIGRGRRQSVQISSSLGLPQIAKLSCHYRHQSLKTQNTHQLDKVHVQRININHKVISLPNTIRFPNQKPTDVNDSAQSISVIFLDSYGTNELKQVFNANHLAIPSVNIKRNDSHWPSLLQLMGKWSDKKESTDKSRQKYRNKKQGFLKRYCVCSPLCKFLSMIGFIFLGTSIAAISIASLPSRATTVTTTIPVTIITQMTTTTTTATPCIPSCNSQQTCVEAICVNVGYLACSLTWSRPGDGDIDVTTPNNRTIYYNNRGPSLSTDGGELDRDDQINEGPENIYWPSNGTVPPTGTYYVCFEPYSISPVISAANPITAVYHITWPPNTLIIFTRTFTSVIKNSYNCDSTAPTLVGSFTYPY